MIIKIKTVFNSKHTGMADRLIALDFEVFGKVQGRFYHKIHIAKTLTI
jgi:hypothetical protein